MKNKTNIQINRYVDPDLGTMYYKAFDAEHPLFFLSGAKLSPYAMRCFFDFNKNIRLQFVERFTSTGVTITRYRQRPVKIKAAPVRAINQSLTLNS